MDVLIAPDSFKESLTAKEAAEAIERGFRSAASETGAPLRIDRCSLSDGGEGFLDVVHAARKGRIRRVRVSGPHGEQIRARWLRLNGARGMIGVIEAAEAIGLARLDPGRRDPERTTSFGVGELIREALDAGCRQIIVGLGGTATCDGGIGAARALGVRFEFDFEQRLEQNPGERERVGLAPYPAGFDLPRITRVDLKHRESALRGVDLIIACDVDNPLCGPHGAARVFAPQKGATPDQVEHLDSGLSNLASRCAEAGVSCNPDQPGAGAAGGLAFGLSAMCGGRIVSGLDLVLEVVGFAERVRGAHLILTGEGRFDAQSLRGKVCAGVARHAHRLGKPTVALVGVRGEGWEDGLESRGGPLRDIIAITPDAMPPAAALAAAPRLLEQCAREVGLEWLGRRG